GRRRRLARGGGLRRLGATERAGVSQTVSATWEPDFRAKVNDSDGVVNVLTQLVAGSSGFATLKRTLTNGATGAGKVNKLWYKRSTLAAAGNDDWVLSGGTNVTDRYANVISFTLAYWF